MPTQTEVEDHNITHMPYRNWCPHCVRGRGKDLDHRRSIDEDRRVREFAFDYCFMGDDAGDKVTILVGRERTTGMTMATVVPLKGSSGQFAVLKILDFIKLCGAEESEAIIKTDQEPAIALLIKDVVQARQGVVTIVEKSPVGSSGSNGVVERAIQSVEGLIRTLKSACEHRWGLTLKPGEKTVLFIAEYASYLVNKLEVGKDGKTAWERSRGKRGVVMAVEFGEKVLWKIKQSGKLAKMSPKWELGVFVGVRAESGEVWVATPEGIHTVRAVRRLPREKRWGADNRDYIKHVPWNRSGDDPHADGDMPPEGAPLEPARVEEDEAPRVVIVNTRMPAPKEFYIRKRDVELHGITKDCAGCRTMFDGGTRQNHSAECRSRFRQLLGGEERVQRMENKRREFDEAAAAKEERRNEKKQRKEERRAGRKRTAEDDGLDVEERLARQAQAEGEDGGDGGRPAQVGGGRPGSSGDGGGGGGMDVDAVAYSDGYWDDVRGGWLDPNRVHEARMEEVGFMQKQGLWDVVPRSRALGHRIVSVRWVDTNKGTLECPDVRCRLVARDFNAGVDRDREDLFAATPPWELKRLLLSHAADRGSKARKIMLIDVKKAHLYPDCVGDVFIELPEEAQAGPDCVGKLKKMLYGLRSAAVSWENHYAGKLESVGFERGAATPVAFYHRERDLSVVVHGDDFTFVGEDGDLNWVAARMKEWYQLKVRARLGPDKGDAKEAVLLGRVIKWQDWGVSCEADPKYRQRILDSLGLETDSKSLASPGTKEEEEQGQPEAVKGDDKAYRALVATINYLATDQPDLQFASKEACRDMAKPVAKSWAKAKRIGRYLVGRLQVVWRFPWKHGHGGWRVVVDSDWAGDRETRRSTSGGVICLGNHCIRTWSSTQSSPALSTCEAEYCAMVDGATRVLGLKAAAKELGIVVEEVEVQIATDSSAAKSYASRRGAGRVRHVDVKQLWLQQAVAEGKFKLQKIDGTQNPADVLTKYRSLSESQALLAKVCVEVVETPRWGNGGAGENGDPPGGWLRLGMGERWADEEEG